MSNHSKLLSPSASHRWIPCTGSSQLIVDAKIENPDSPASIRGTAMHDVAEQVFLGLMVDIPTEPQYKGHVIDEDEWEQIEKAVGWANEYIEGLDDEDVVVLTEGEVSMPAPYDDCFGTADIIIYSPRLKLVCVLDYKFGYNHVGALANPQLKTYVMAAILSNPDWEVEEVNYGILGPQFNRYIDVADMGWDEIRDWYDTVLAPRMEAIVAGKGTLSAGGHCESAYCPMRGQCPEQNKYATDIMEDFVNSDDESYLPSQIVTPEKVATVTADGEHLVLTDRELGEAYDKLQGIKSIISSMESVIMTRLQDGNTIECKEGSLKLVNGQGKRVFKDEDRAIKYLKNKLGAEKCYVKKLITAPQAEKLMKPLMKDSKQIKDNFYGHVEKLDGALTFARATDRRPEVTYEDPLLGGAIEDEVDDIIL